MSARRRGCSRSLIVPSRFPSAGGLSCLHAKSLTSSQGFASGDLAEDAWAVRHFLERDTLEMAVAQSFSKNMGLYGERVGALHLLCRTSMAADKAKGHLARFQRGQISQPPTTGARLAATILSDPELFQGWLLDLGEMSGRIRQMRRALHDELVALGTPGRWHHVISQVCNHGPVDSFWPLKPAG